MVDKTHFSDFWCNNNNDNSVFLITKEYTQMVMKVNTKKKSCIFYWQRICINFFEAKNACFKAAIYCGDPLFPFFVVFHVENSLGENNDFIHGSTFLGERDMGFVIWEK